MRAEAILRVADSANQLLLLPDRKRPKKRATARHPLRLALNIAQSGDTVTPDVHCADGRDDSVTRSPALSRGRDLGIAAGRNCLPSDRNDEGRARRMSIRRAREILIAASRARPARATRDAGACASAPASAA